MSVLLLLLSFFAIWINRCCYKKLKTTLVYDTIVSILIFCSLLIIGTELLSFFKVLNATTVAGFWALCLGGNVLLLFRNKDQTRLFVQKIYQRLQNERKGLGAYEKYAIGGIILFLTLIFIQGVVYPPNNWDSMTYHLSRISSWVSNQSVDHYPTNIYRQIFQMPFAEFVIMHINLLSGNDYFSNSVQFFFLLFSGVAIIGILDVLGLGRSSKLLSVILWITMPEAILQASSTQNDLVIAFFVLTAIYFALQLFIELKHQLFLFLGVTVGLGVLTKGTAFIYFAPILLGLALVFVFHIYKKRNYKMIASAILSGVLVLAFNSRHWLRNYNLAGNPLGGVESNFTNNKMSPLILTSSILKNIGNHIGPYPITTVTETVLEKIHNAINVDINDADLTYGSTTFKSGRRFAHEDSAPNPIHICLILCTYVLLFLPKNRAKWKNNRAAQLALLLLLQFVLFCALLKWQPWHTRLHLSLFLTAIPLLCFVVSLQTTYKKLMRLLIPVLFLYGFCVILFNMSRPFVEWTNITLPINIKDSRFKKYFANRSNEVYEDYQNISDLIRERQCKYIGLFMDGNHWIYPLFGDGYVEVMHPIYINITNASKKLLTKIERLDCIVSTIENKEFIEFEGKRYVNNSLNNKNIWIYCTDEGQ